MKTKHINTLADLRQAKKELKERMRSADQEAQEGFLYSTVNKLFSGIENNSYVHRSPIGSGVNNVLNFLSTQAQNRFQLSNTAKSLISIGIVIAAPLIAKKVQGFIDRKF